MHEFRAGGERVAHTDLAMIGKGRIDCQQLISVDQIGRRLIDDQQLEQIFRRRQIHTGRNRLDEVLVIQPICWQLVSRLTSNLVRPRAGDRALMAEVILRGHLRRAPVSCLRQFRADSQRRTRRDVREIDAQALFLRKARRIVPSAIQVIDKRLHILCILKRRQQKTRLQPFVVRLSSLPIPLLAQPASVQPTTFGSSPWHSIVLSN